MPYTKVAIHDRIREHKWIGDADLGIPLLLPCAISATGRCDEMTKTVYVGNLPWSANEEDLRDLFSARANVTVESARVVSDRETGRSKGFGFVELEEQDLAGSVEALNNFEYDGRPLTVNEARPREERPRRY